LRIPEKQIAAALFSNFSLLWVTCAYLDISLFIIAHFSFNYTTYTIFISNLAHNIFVVINYCFGILRPQLPEDGRELWPKRVGAITNNDKHNVQQVANKYGTCHTVQQKMYNINFISSKANKIHYFSTLF
jgi:hypothetical protein